MRQAARATLALAVLWAGTANAAPILYGAAHDGRNGPSTFYTIDPTTGAATAVGAIGFERVSGIDFHPLTGVLYGTGERSDGSNTHVLITIDPFTGLGTEVGTTGVELFTDGTFGSGFDTAAGISFRNFDSTLFAYTFDNDGLATTDIGSGLMTEIGASTSPIGDSGYGLAFSPDDTLFVTSTGLLHTLDQSGGPVLSTLTLTDEMSNPFEDIGFNALDFHPETEVLYASLRDSSFENFLEERGQLA